MKVEFSHNMASLVGVREAIIAQRLFDVLVEQIRCGVAFEKEGNYWIRASGRDLTAAFPFFSKDGCLDALQHLRDKHVLIKGCYNESRFDHTYWHAFTRYGLLLMMKERGEIYDGRTGEATEIPFESIYAPVITWR